MNNIYRHGDLSFKPIKELPKNLQKVNKNDSFILALGEATGHRHVITAPRLEILQDTNGKYFISLKEKADLSHEEHKTITLLPGIYEMNNEREMDWFSRAVRKVVD